jgi:uncharacterized protein YlxW (UPF0749 family)
MFNQALNASTHAASTAAQREATEANRLHTALTAAQGKVNELATKRAKVIEESAKYEAVKNTSFGKSMYDQAQSALAAIDKELVNTSRHRDQLATLVE